MPPMAPERRCASTTDPHLPSAKTRTSKEIQFWVRVNFQKSDYSWNGPSSDHLTSVGHNHATLSSSSLSTHHVFAAGI
eukprot:620250-Amphidinium_carterae.1